MVSIMSISLSVIDQSRQWQEGEIGAGTGQREATGPGAQRESRTYPGAALDALLRLFSSLMRLLTALNTAVGVRIEGEQSAHTCANTWTSLCTNARVTPKSSTYVRPRREIRQGTLEPKQYSVRMGSHHTVPVSEVHRLQSGAYADLLYWRRYPQFSNCLRTPPVQDETACTRPYSTPLHTAKLPI